MALKLKMEKDGLGVDRVVVQDGKPVYIDDADGKELAFDAEQMRTKISELNNESKQHRLTAKEKAELLDKYKGADPEAVSLALATIEELGGADGIKKLKEKSGLDVEAIKKSITESYEGKLADAMKTLGEKDGTIRQLLVGNGFATAKSLEGTIFKDTRDVAESYFGKHFKVENGKPVAYIGENAIISRDKPGELADVNEALAILIDQHPQRDSFKLATGGGSGAHGGGKGGKGGDNTISRDEFFRLPAFKQSELASKGVQITD